MYCSLTFSPPEEKLERSNWGPTHCHDLPKDMIDGIQIKLARVGKGTKRKRSSKLVATTQELEVEPNPTIPSRAEDIIAAPTLPTLVCNNLYWGR